MYFGELKEQTLDYQHGHFKGGERMANFLIFEFKKVYPSKTSEVEFLKKVAGEWRVHCLTFGYGKEEKDYVTTPGIVENHAFPPEVTKSLTTIEEVAKAQQNAAEALKRAEQAEKKLAAYKALPWWRKVFCIKR